MNHHLQSVSSEEVCGVTGDGKEQTAPLNGVDAASADVNIQIII